MVNSEYLESCLILPDLYIECRNQTDYITLLAPPHVAIPLPAAIRLSLLKRRKMVVSEYFEILLPCLILPEQWTQNTESHGEKGCCMLPILPLPAATILGTKSMIMKRRQQSFVKNFIMKTVILTILATTLLCSPNHPEDRQFKNPDRWNEGVIGDFVPDRVAYSYFKVSTSTSKVLVSCSALLWFWYWQAFNELKTVCKLFAISVQTLCNQWTNCVQT